MQPIVTPERWYIIFWICMALSVLVLNALFTGIAIYFAIKWTRG